MPCAVTEGHGPLSSSVREHGGSMLVLTWPRVLAAACSSPWLPACSLAAMPSGLLPPQQTCIAVLPAVCDMPSSCHQELLCSMSSFSAASQRGAVHAAGSKVRSTSKTPLRQVSICAYVF